MEAEVTEAELESTEAELEKAKLQFSELMAMGTASGDHLDLAG